MRLSPPDSTRIRSNASWAVNSSIASRLAVMSSRIACGRAAGLHGRDPVVRQHRMCEAGVFGGVDVVGRHRQRQLSRTRRHSRHQCTTEPPTRVVRPVCGPALAGAWGTVRVWRTRRRRSHLSGNEQGTHALVMPLASVVHSVRASTSLNSLVVASARPCPHSSIGRSPRLTGSAAVAGGDGRAGHCDVDEALKPGRQPAQLPTRPVRQMRPRPLPAGNGPHLPCQPDQPAALGCVEACLAWSRCARVGSPVGVVDGQLGAPRPRWTPSAGQGAGPAVSGTLPKCCVGHRLARWFFRKAA